MEEHIIEAITNRVCHKIGNAMITVGLICGSAAVITIVTTKYLQKHGYIH